MWAGEQDGIPVGDSGGTLYYNSAGIMPPGARPVVKSGIDRCVAMLSHVPQKAHILMRGL